MAYHTAFKGVMSTLRHFQFPGDTQWAFSVVTARLPECVYLKIPPGTILTTVGYPRWLGLVLQGHIEAVPGAPNLTGDLKIFGAESLEPRAHQQQWVAVVETTFLAIPYAVTEAIHQESVGYADSSGLLQTVIHNQLGSLTHIVHEDSEADAAELQEPLHILSPIVTAYMDRELDSMWPLIAPDLQKLHRLQKGLKSYLTACPERTVTNCHHRILSSSGDAYFDTRKVHLDRRVAKDLLQHYDITVEYGTNGIHTIFHHPSPSRANGCTIHTELTTPLDPYCHDLSNRTGVLVLPNEQGAKKNFIEAQARPNATLMERGSTENDTIGEMIEVLAYGQKAHARKRLLMIYVANKDRDTALASLRLKQLERPSLRALNHYLAGDTKWTGTVCSKFDGCSGDEAYVKGYTEPVPTMGVLLDNFAEWCPTPIIESREINVQHMDHEDLYNGIHNGRHRAVEEATKTVVLEFPDDMEVTTLHKMFKFLNETNLEVQTSIAVSLPSNNFHFMGAMEAKASRSESKAYEVNLPKLLVPKATRVIMTVADAKQ